ncbi:efflux RND transporter permease subunit [Thalassolituus sp. LLYu03]|uniref:efflux RND transporter permease subunit n=1 Tax=Thalassolituus sp. LLYu03 TaxID=3421656 RepID=UPI003D2AF6C7
MNAVMQMFTGVQRHPWLMMLGLLLVTVLALGSAGQLQINSTPYMIDNSHPSRIADHDTKRLFSNSGEQAFVALDNPDGNVFNAKSLATVQELSRAFERLLLISDMDSQHLTALAAHDALAPQANAILQDGLTAQDIPQLKQLAQNAAVSAQDKAWLENLAVRLRPVKRVRSLARMEHIEAFTGGLEVHPLMKTLPQTDAERQALREAALNNPMFINGLVSPQGNATTIQVEFNIAEDDSPAMLLAYNEISRIINDVTARDGFSDRVYLSGPPMIAAQTATSMEQDNQTLLPGVLLVIIVVLLLSFGRLQGVVAPLLIAVISLFWTLGAMAAFGVKQNIVSSMLPVFIIAIAVCDAIHFLATYYRLLPDNPDRAARTQAASEALRKLFWPMLVTSVTTMAGFFALSWTEIIFIREFGIFVGLGVMFAWIVTMLFLPALVILWKAPRPRFGLLVSDLIGRLMSLLGRVAGHGKGVVAAVLVLMVAGLVYTQQNLTVDNQVIGYFQPDSRIRQDDAAINANFGGSTVVSFLLESKEIDAFKNPAVIEAVAKLQQQLNGEPLVGFTLSPVDFIKRMHQVLSATDGDVSGSAADYRLPSDLTQPMLAQYYLLYENANGQDLFDVVDRRFSNGRIVTVLHSDRSSEVGAVIARLLDEAQSQLPAGVSIRAAGYGEILVSTTEAVVWGQIQSLLLAVVLIALLVVVILRSLRLGLLALLPLLFTLVGVFTLMALTGTDLDIGTSIIAAISFGIGIDYAVHTIAALRLAKGENQAELIANALQYCGKPILINTLALGFGFLVLTLSGYQALVNLGYFISLTMLFSALFALLVLPAFHRPDTPQAELADGIDDAQAEPVNA